MAEYKAIILALTKLHGPLAQWAIIKTDSQVISGHIEKSFKVREPDLQKFLQIVHKIEEYFMGITTKSIPLAKNSKANEQARAIAQALPLPPNVFYEILHQPSTDTNTKPLKLINTIDNID